MTVHLPTDSQVHEATKVIVPQWSAPTGTRIIAGCEFGTRLPSFGLATRWLARSLTDGCPRVLYEIAPRAIMGDRAEVIRAGWRLSRVKNRHLLSIEHLELDDVDHLWIVCPYVGGYDGLVTLSRILSQRPQSQFDPHEAALAAAQILEALALMQSRSLRTGLVRIEELLVDRHGCILLELAGLQQALQGEAGTTDESNRAETRAAIQIIYEMITGHPPATSPIPARRVNRETPRRLDAWIRRGLDSPGYIDAAEALRVLSTEAR